MGLPRLQCRRAEPATVEPATMCENVGGGAPRQRTWVRTAWDSRMWHLAFEMEDACPWATLTGHDAPLWTEETVEVFIDPVGDLESYFEIEINPLGAVVDVVLRRVVSGWRKDFGWHVDGLQSCARLTDTGWRAELAIPFTSLVPSPPSVGACWRVNFLRIDRPGGPGTEAELSAWSPTGIRNFHRPEFFGTLEFV